MKNNLKYFAIVLSIVCGLFLWNSEDAQLNVSAGSGVIEGETGVEEVPDGFWNEKVSDVFSDVKKGAWYEPGVQYVYDNGLMSGNKGLFNPTADITRAQLVTTLYRLVGEPKVTDKSALTELSDVTEGTYYTNAVCWAYAKGVTTGSSGKFLPADKLTRQQLAAFFFRFAEAMEMDTTARGDYSSMLNADKVATYAAEPMAWAVGTGLINGSDVNINGVMVKDLNPGGNTTRAQVATILMRFCEK